MPMPYCKMPCHPCLTFLLVFVVCVESLSNGLNWSMFYPTLHGLHLVSQQPASTSTCVIVCFALPPSLNFSARPTVPFLSNNFFEAHSIACLSCMPYM